MRNHSPTPWKYGFEVCSLGKLVVIWDADEQLIMARRVTEGTDYNRLCNDAAHIVACFNAIAELRLDHRNASTT